MEVARIRLEPHRIVGDDLTVAAELDHPDLGRHRLWWRLPARWRDAVTPWADPFVVGFIFMAMQRRRDVVVEGRVSPSLLANLDTFMALWHAWKPQAYRPVDIRGQEEAEAPLAPGGRTVLGFSCGVDSCFTLFRHRQGLMGRRTRDIAAGVVLNGFDIHLDDLNAQAMYDGLLDRSRILLDSQGAACIPLAGNFHELPTHWTHSYSTHLISGLRMLAGGFASAVVSNDMPYMSLHFPWGSHPLSNPMLGSRSFEIIDEGGELPRHERVDMVSRWPLALRHLRVCFNNPGSLDNCCRCEKCIRTIICFRLAGAGLPPAFAHDVSDRAIRHLRIKHPWQQTSWEYILDLARQRGLGGASWAKAIRTAFRRSRRRRYLDRFRKPLIPLRNAIRRVFRGSALSRQELARKAESGVSQP